MPVKVGCASDYNKNHPYRIRKKRNEETIVLVANKSYGWVDIDDHIIELAPRDGTYDEWKKSEMTPGDWKKFSSKYTAEMKSAESQNNTESGGVQQGRRNNQIALLRK
jgi:uncharacterized protein YeaO (DUF488 family)